MLRSRNAVVAEYRLLVVEERGRCHVNRGGVSVLSRVRGCAAYAGLASGRSVVGCLTWGQDCLLCCVSGDACPSVTRSVPGQRKRNRRGLAGEPIRGGTLVQRSA